VVLPDTSVWVDFARLGAQGRAAGLRELLDSGEVATCGPVVAELLAGTEGDVADRMWQTLSSLPWVELTPESWRDVGFTAHRLRHSGRTLPLTDLAIAVSAARSGHALWSFDSDFDRLVGTIDGFELYSSAS
jgi:predicted nucleic acid-binding protein